MATFSAATGCVFNWTAIKVSVIVVHRLVSGTHYLRKALNIMSKSFYHFLMKYRHPEPKDDISRFANQAYLDHAFPKSSKDYHELSSYLELNGHYLASMSVFDEAWQEYLVTESKS